MKRLAVLMLAATLLVGLFACGGGGGGGGAVYSAAGKWQVAWSRAAPETVGWLFTFKSDGSGKVNALGISLPLAWTQSGNTMTWYVQGAGEGTFKLSWDGPDKFTATNQSGGKTGFVRVGYARGVVVLPRGDEDGARLLSSLKAMATGR